jgi:hypothetical protein
LPTPSQVFLGENTKLGGMPFVVLLLAKTPAKVTLHFPEAKSFSTILLANLLTEFQSYFLWNH